MNYSPGPPPPHDFLDHSSTILYDRTLFSHLHLDASLSAHLIVLPALHTSALGALIFVLYRQPVPYTGFAPIPPTPFASIYQFLLHLTFRYTYWIRVFRSYARYPALTDNHTNATFPLHVYPGGSRDRPNRSKWNDVSCDRFH